MSLKKIFIDFNSYFASVEQHLRPELRDKPIAVVPVLADSSCCIAVSYEAKAFGVKTGTINAAAKQLCPQIQLVKSRHTEYNKMHHRLVELVESCLPVDEVLSIDEMVCTLHGRFAQRQAAEEIAATIKSKIAQKVGPVMRSSIGIAPNTFLAKTASDMQKPDGLTVIELNDLPKVLHRLELNDICGIGKRMLERLHQCGIYTVETLCAAEPRKLRQAWGGIEGERMHAMLRGEDIWRPETKHRTLGHSNVLSPEMRTQEHAYTVIHKLLQKAAMRLREKNSFARSLEVKVKFIGKQKWKDQMKVAETQSTQELSQALRTLWNRRNYRSEKPFHVAISLNDIISAENHTPSLFDCDRKNTLDTVMDELNRNYGDNTVYYGK